MPFGRPGHGESQHQRRPAAYLDVETPRAQHEQERDDQHRAGNVQEISHPGDAHGPPGQLMAAEEILLYILGSPFFQIDPQPQQDHKIDDDHRIIGAVKISSQHICPCELVFFFLFCETVFKNRYSFERKKRFPCFFVPGEPFLSK